VLWRGRWDEPRIFSEIQAAGDVADDEMAHVFNLGLGMVAVVPARDAHDALDAVRAAGQEAWIVGEVSEGRGRVSITRN
jgi:phosphoribosylformylglycinamidine cyclo-ligase